MYRSSDGVVTLALPDCALNTTDPGSSPITATLWSPELIAAVQDNSRVSTSWATTRFSSVSSPLYSVEIEVVFFYSTLDSSCVNLHRADRASQEVRQRSGIVYPVNFQNKTSCDDLDLQPKKVGNINNKHNHVAYSTTA